MSKYTVGIAWERNGARFTDNRYKRCHYWLFDGGTEVMASSSPEVVPVPLSDPAAVDPEEAFVASLSSCHMLWFLSVVAGRGYIVNRYKDNAEGWLEKDAAGRLVMTRVVLRPHVEYAKGSAPSPDENDHMHHEAHQKCFIANSVHTEIKIKSSMNAKS